MNIRNILTVYRKELRDLLRDRRTVISMVVVPTLLMPGLLAAVVLVSIKVTRQAIAVTPKIMVVGGEDSPRARDALVADPKLEVVPIAPNWRQLISDKRIRAAVEFPAGFDAAIERGEKTTVKISHYTGEMRSDLAEREISRRLRDYSDEIVSGRLAAHGLTKAAIKPFEISTENVAPPEKVGGNLFGGLVPYFFLLLSFTGAMYPALDLTAGEKERGTMETILCSPVARADLVLGKFLMILTASLGTVVCSLVSTAVTLAVAGFAVLPRMTGGSADSNAGAAAKIAAFMTLDPVGMVAVVGMVIPMAVLFAAVLFTIALFAKSFKEAQSYVSPLIILILLPAAVGMLPGVELNARLALVPILNVSLVSKELVSGVWHWQYLALIFGSTCVYAALALALAVRMFEREDVIFRA
jgi:sodium transport system permease protein